MNMSNISKSSQPNKLQIEAGDAKQVDPSELKLKKPEVESLVNTSEKVVKVAPKEINGPKGLEPTRYGDWESKGRCYDF